MKMDLDKEIDIFEEKEVSKILLDPVRFFEFVTRLKPYSYQAEFLRMKAKRIAVRSGRQIGKTTMCAVRALHIAFMYPHQQILILAPVQRQSSLLFWMIKDFIASNPFIKSKVVRETLTQLYFDNGSEIHCLPAGHTGDRIRGFSPTEVIKDEDAFIPDAVDSAIEPSLAATDGNLVRVSTPYGKRGPFWEAFQPKSNYKLFHIRSSDCPMISKEFLEDKKRRLPKNEYLQEYEGEFTEYSDTVFKRGDIKIAMVGEELDQPEANHKYDMGVDCARYGEDRNVFTIADKTDKKVIKIISSEKEPATATIGRIKSLQEIWKCEWINIDSSNIGGPVLDALIEEGYPARPIDFNSIKIKESLYRNLITLIENHILKILHNDNLKVEMGNQTYSYTSQGMSIHHPERGHDDYPDSLALAVINIRPVETEEEELYIVT